MFSLAKIIQYKVIFTVEACSGSSHFRVSEDLFLIKQILHVVTPLLFFPSGIQEELCLKLCVYHALQNHFSSAGCTFLVQWLIYISKYDNMVDHKLAQDTCVRKDF